MVCGGYKDLAVLCFVYSGQIIQTTDIPAVLPAVVLMLQAVSGGRESQESSGEDTDRRAGVCTKCFSHQVRFKLSLQVYNPTSAP